MKTVLGLALTSTDVSWALLAGDDVTDDAVLDDDAFAVDDGDELAERGIAAARGAQAIAASSGHDVCSVGLTGDDDTAAEAEKLIAALKSAGFDDVRIVPSELIADDELSAAHGAARVVVTDAVPAQVTMVDDASVRRCTPKWVWVGGASAAAVVIGVVAAGALFMVGDTEPPSDAAALTAAGSTEIVTAAVPRLTPPTIAVHAQDVQPARKVIARAGRPEVEAPTKPWTPPVEAPAKPVSSAAEPVDVLRPEVAPAAHPAVPAAAPSTPATPLAGETTPAAATAHLPQNLTGPVTPGPVDVVAPAEAPAQAAPPTTAAPASPTPTVPQAAPAAATEAPTAQAPAAVSEPQAPAAPANPFDLFAALP